MARVKSKSLLTTYISPKRTREGLKFRARVVDGQTRAENKCSRETLRQAVDCGRDKVFGR